eukprot:1396470-Pleurochrysis_carterae.AAC.2
MQRQPHDSSSASGDTRTFGARPKHLTAGKECAPCMQAEWVEWLHLLCSILNTCWAKSLWIYTAGLSRGVQGGQSPYSGSNILRTKAKPSMHFSYC